MKREEFEYRLKELVAKVDSRIAADVLLQEARSQFLGYAMECASTQFKLGQESMEGAVAAAAKAPSILER